MQNERLYEYYTFILSYLQIKDRIKHAKTGYADKLDQLLAMQETSLTLQQKALASQESARADERARFEAQQALYADRTSVLKDLVRSMNRNSNA
jgi:hypothetical protein